MIVYARAKRKFRLPIAALVILAILILVICLSPILLAGCIIVVLYLLLRKCFLAIYDFFSEPALCITPDQDTDLAIAHYQILCGNLP